MTVYCMCAFQFRKKNGMCKIKTYDLFKIIYVQKPYAFVGMLEIGCVLKKRICDF